MRWLLIAAALLSAPNAAAQDYDAAPVISAQRDGDGGSARASIDISAPPATVWAVLSDCAQASKFMRHLISCRVLQAGDGWDVREHRVRGWPLRPVMRNVSRIELEPNRRLSFHRLDGDWTRSDGEWVLTPLDGGRGTHVEYRLTAALSGGVPSWLSRSLLINSIRGTLTSLRRETEQRNP